MREIFLIAVMAVCANVSAWGQGSVVFANFGQPIYCGEGIPIPVGSAAAANSGWVAFGKSGIIRVDTGNPLIGEAPVSLVAAGFQGFYAWSGAGCVPGIIPEPVGDGTGIRGDGNTVGSLRAEEGK